MAVEFDVCLRRPAVVRNVLDGAAGILAAVRSSDIRAEEPDDRTLDAPLTCLFMAEQGATVSMTVVLVSDVPDEAGLWASFAAARTDGSVFLAALLAASVAQCVGTGLVDESNLLGMGRDPSDDAVVACLQAALGSTQTLDEAGRKLVGQ
jgi:hypothetical protein